MADFYTIVTNVGLAKINAAVANGTKLALEEYALGDGNGIYVTPSPTQVRLVNERYRGEINSVSINNEHANWLDVICVVPTHVGGFTIREVALFDVDGDLIAITKHPATYKPLPSEGTAKELFIKNILALENASSVTIAINGSESYITKEYVDGAIKTHKLDTASHNTWVTCTTASADTAKVGTASGFTLAIGSTVRVKFTNANTADAPTLNVNSTGAKTLKKADGTVFTKIVANGVYSFVYDGTSFTVLGEGGDYNVDDTIRVSNLLATGDVLPASTLNLIQTSANYSVCTDANNNIYVAVGKTVKKYNASGVLQLTFPDDTESLTDVKVDAIGNVYTCGQSKLIKKYNASGSLLWTFSGHTVFVLAIAVDALGNVHSASGDKTVKKIDSSGTLVWTFSGHTDQVYDIDVDAIGNVYSCGIDKTVKKIDSSGTLVWTFSGHTDQVYGVAVDTNGNVYSTSVDKTIKKIDSSGTLVWTFSGLTSFCRKIAVDTNNNAYIASDDKTAKKINSSGTLVWTFSGHTAVLLNIHVDKNGNVYSCGNDYTVKKIIEYSDTYKIIGAD